MKKKIFFAVILLAGIFLIATPSFANPCDPNINISNRSLEELVEIIKACEEKLENIRSKINTLSSEIAYMDTQIYLTQLKINKTEKKIEELKEQIKILDSKIEDLDLSLDHLSKVFIKLTELIYKSRPKPFFVNLILSHNFNEALLTYKYLKEKQSQNQRLMLQIQRTKLNFQEQKKLREEKRKELAELNKTLNLQKEELKNQQMAKRKLLELTRNDEKNYQLLLQRAERQLASFKAFVKRAGRKIIPANGFGTGKLGWYYSQRDARWANVYIGESTETILDVGCLVTDIAMLYKSEGYNITPADIARDVNRFLPRTAYMLIKWKAPQGTYTEIPISSIDIELSQGRKVIVGLKAGSYGTHFVILVSKQGDDYIMYDPYYGPDLPFSEKYSKSQIYKAVVFK